MPNKTFAELRELILSGSCELIEIESDLYSDDNWISIFKKLLAVKNHAKYTGLYLVCSDGVLSAKRLQQILDSSEIPDDIKIKTGMLIGGQNAMKEYYESEDFTQSLAQCHVSDPSKETPFEYNRPEPADDMFYGEQRTQLMAQLETQMVTGGGERPSQEQIPYNLQRRW